MCGEKIYSILHCWRTYHNGISLKKPHPTQISFHMFWAFSKSKLRYKICIKYTNQCHVCHSVLWLNFPVIQITKELGYTGEAILRSVTDLNESVRRMRDNFYLLLSYCCVYLSYCLFIKQLHNTDGRQSNPPLCLLPGQEVIPTLTLLSPRLHLALFTSTP